MSTLHVDLQRGFQDETVVVTVDGETVYEQSNVNTSLMTGFAESFEVDVEQRSHQIEARLPDRNISDSITVTVEAETYLGVSVEDSQVVFRLSEEPFVYM